MASEEQWMEARRKYETTGLSAAKIADSIGVSGAAMSKHAKKNGWIKFNANAVVNGEVVPEVKALVNVELGGYKPGHVNHPAVVAENQARVQQYAIQRNQPVKDVKYSEEVANEVLQRLKNGETLKAICADEHLPSDATVRYWAATDHEGFFSRYTSARQIGYDRMAEEIIDIADADPGTNDNGQTDSGAVQWQRLRIDTRKWLLAKVIFKRYGDRRDLHVTGNVTTTSTDRAALVEEFQTLLAKGAMRAPKLLDGGVTDVEPKA